MRVRACAHTHTHLPTRAWQYDTLAREDSIPTLAESDGYAERSLYTVAAAAVSWGGVEKHSIPYAEPSVGYAVGIDKVL